MALYGGIEAGGTKWVCAVGTGPDDLREEVRFPTTTPEETLGKAVAFFRAQAPVSAIGVGSFGPVDLRRDSPSYGSITSTPKPGWQNTDVLGVLRGALGVPIGFDTDVNVAALGEHRWGAAQGLDTFVYLTVGTGIGGGVMAGGRLLHGMLHPEIGHMRLPHDRQRDPFAGACPFHGDCLEGLAAGPAVERRWGVRGEQLPLGHPAWELEAHYLAQAAASLVCILSPQRIIYGGGVLRQPGMLDRVRAETVALLNGYVRSPEIEQAIDRYIVPPGLGERSGVLGALALAASTAAEGPPA